MVKKIQLIHKDLSYQIIGALFDVHNQLGSGLKERTYERALCAAFQEKNIDYQNQVYVPVMFNDQKVGSYYLDFLIHKLVVLELKVGDYFTRNNIKQIYQYLLLKDLQLGLLANFTTNGVKVKRIVNIE